MLSDYIPVYFPSTNEWSIPSRELEKYEDYVVEPQEIGLYEGAVIRGVPLVHFGTWGAFGLNITEVVRNLANDPVEACKKYYKDRGVRKDVVKFFKALVEKYPAIREVKAFDRRREGCDPLDVPDGTVVRRRPRRKPRRKVPVKLDKVHFEEGDQP